MKMPRQLASIWQKIFQNDGFDQYGKTIARKQVRRFSQYQSLLEQLLGELQ